MAVHNYRTSLRWTGNRGAGTSDYKAYARDYEINVAGKSPALPGSSDAHFRGDPARYNPEDLLVASVSACHMLSYLHVCAVNGIVVTSYEDDAVGVLVETADGGGSIASVTLRPRVAISASSDRDKAMALHHEAHKLCFIANSVRFPVACEATIAKPGEAAEV